VARYSAAHYFLEGLVDLGVEYIFANLGTDHVSLIEELARWDKQGRGHPEIILCPHEVVAVHMAGGYALATGRAQAVLVHVDAGTANACMAIQNLFRYRLPVMLFAGRAPHTLHGELTGSRDTYVHFVQDPFDIASIVRPYVKWEYSLPSGVVVKEALARASAVAHSDPPGPVYMMLPRETLAEEWDEAAMPPYLPTRYGSVQAGGIEPARVDAIADALSGALNPAFVLATLSGKISQDDVVLNEAIRNGPVLQEHVKRTKPQSYVGLAGGGLGFSGGMALGLKLARPGRRIVQVIGDGGFHFSSPDSVYAVAQQYEIPIFTVVLDNGGWQAVKSATQRVYPKGVAAETDQFQSRLTSGRQGERRDFSAVAKAFGAHGECVTEPDALADAIDRCLAAVDDGKAAVLHVHVTRL
jgi:thiamine pyrophosphate-dependent acetolactate synthase large subunit-like protein